jgi:hypothetical protein
MLRALFFMVLCLSIFWFPPANSQSRPHRAAELFLSKKLSDENRSSKFLFDEPIRKGNIWIFETRKPDGFVLVKETDSCRIVGYSTRNRFTRDNKIPGPAQAFVETLDRMTDLEIISNKLKTSPNPVGPMIRTRWSQEGYFNYYCPEDINGPDNHVYAGCAAVAMGQILRYYGKSNDFQVTASTTDYEYGTLTATIGNYDWNAMENQPITIDTEVSQLLYGLGVLTRMDYGPSGSTTSNYNVYDSFKKLKYFDAIRMIRSTTVLDVWIRNFTRNIEDYQPIYVSGSGHSFICDGIDAGGMFHFNLGWYGYADGYYPLNLVLTINISEAIFNLRPYSNNLPPTNLWMDTVNGQRLLKWEKNRLTTVDPIFYRIHINDTTYYDNSSTTFNTLYLAPGDHELMVSAVYPQGESTSIGPIQFSVEGDQVNIPDNALKQAIQEELLREDVTQIYESPTINQLLKIKKLEIRQHPGSLSGLEHCHNIQLLSIHADEPVSLDIGPISLLKRLKWLELKNIQITNPDLLGHNVRLIHLDLTSSPAGSLSFLRELPELLNLKVQDTEVTDTQIFGILNTLTDLTISGCSIQTATFAQSLTGLKYLDVSRNRLTRFRLNDKLPELHHLDISHNQVNDLFFMEYVPEIEYLNVGNNLITRFITGLNFKKIRELNLENNQIDSLSISVPMTVLQKLRINENNIRTIKYLKDYAPALTELNIAGNSVQDFWLGSLQFLEYLNCSNNRINLINDLTANPSLKHIDLSYNQLTDLYPLFDHTNCYGMEYLDLTGNPLSTESTQDFAPYLHTTIDTLLTDLPQVNAPGNPQPARNTTIPGETANLSWSAGEIPATGYYEVFTGTSRSSLSLTGTVTSSTYQLNVSPGKQFFWRVRTVLPDTSYFSGLFKFITYQPMALPYKENFESYASYTSFSEQSTCWIRSVSGPLGLTDGRIDPARKSEGKQSLKLMNASDVRLPLNHLYQSVLYISMQLLVEDGCIGSVRLNDINGTNLELYFKSNGRCDIIFNNKLQAEIPFKNGEWLPLQVNMYTKGKQIWVNLDSNSLPIDWIFTGEMVHVGELELASAAGTLWPTDGNPVFRVDEIQIKASGSMGTENIPASQDILIYPNPASQWITIEIPDSAVKPEIRLYDLSGRMVDTYLTQECQGRWRINVIRMNPGIYLVRIKSAGISKTVKVCINQ